MSTTVVVTPQPAAPAPRMQFDQMVEKFVALRDKVAEIKKKQAEALAPYNLAMATLEGWMLDVLNTNGAQSMRAPAGTAYKSTTVSTKVVDWTTTLAFIREHEVWELLEARVSKLAVEAIIEDTKQPVPGVNVTREISLNVRRG